MFPTFSNVEDSIFGRISSYSSSGIDLTNPIWYGHLHEFGSRKEMHQADR
jgi:hypothetical protein